MNGSRPVDLDVPRIALRVPDEAAAALGMKPTYFDEHVRHELKIIRRGRLAFVATSELQRWAEQAGTVAASRKAS